MPTSFGITSLWKSRASIGCTNVYQPKLQTEKQAACFFRYHRGRQVASSSLMGEMTRDFLRQVDAFIEKNEIPVVHFKKGQRKDDVAAEYRARFSGTEGVLFVGKAQEKVTVFRTEKRTNPVTGQKYPWIVKSATPVNQLYFYCMDEEFGPFFLGKLARFACRLKPDFR